MNKRFIILLAITLLLGCECSVKPDPVKIGSVTQVYPKDWFSGYLDFNFEDISTHMHYFYFPSQSAHPN